MRALISVYDKFGIVEFAKGLESLGVEIISTGGTFRILKENNVSVKEVSDVTKFPEMMDGRVKTLNPLIHGGILADRDKSDHILVAEEHDIGLIDIVAVNLYPFEETMNNPTSTLEEIVEKIDIGGPTMVRSAAKNYKHVMVIVNPKNYDDVLQTIEKKVPNPELRQRLMVEAFSHTAKYDAIISTYFHEKFVGQSFAGECAIGLSKKQELRYGENSHQQAAFYSLTGDHGLVSIKQHHGKDLSFNNFIDTNAAYQIVKSFSEPAAVVIKHTNPCGASVAKTISEAYKRAYEADSVSAFGGIIGLNRECDIDTAELISKIFVEVVIAPSFHQGALDILKKKKNIRLIEKSDFFEDHKELDIRKVAGGFLVQEEDNGSIKESQLELATKHKPTDQQVKDMLMGWSIIKYVKSNAIVLVKDGVLVGVGAGQMSRIEAVELAVKRAGNKVKGAVLASDAFFPFKDSVELAYEAGVEAIIQPGGSVRDKDSIDVCDEFKLSMCFTGMRHFRH
jgi:phosphoribosylaminoimidazolecarboxamide formyltransferase / IMP cyclohydrolase